MLSVMKRPYMADGWMCMAGATPHTIVMYNKSQRLSLNKKLELAGTL